MTKLELNRNRHYGQYILYSPAIQQLTIVAAEGNTQGEAIPKLQVQFSSESLPLILKIIAEMERRHRKPRVMFHEPGLLEHASPAEGVIAFELKGVSLEFLQGIFSYNDLKSVIARIHAKQVTLVAISEFSLKKDIGLMAFLEHGSNENVFTLEIVRSEPAGIEVVWKAQLPAGGLQ